jgi:hypothetical protein
MQILNINLSGTGGLVSGFARKPVNLTYQGLESQMVGGVYNPFVYPGFLAPGRNYRKTLTQATTPTVNLTCVYDKATGKFMTASQEGIINIFADPDDTTANTGRNEVTANGLGSTTLPIYDFEIYQLNGVRKVFYSNFNVDLLQATVGVTNGTDFCYNWSNSGTNANLYTGTVSGGGTFSKPVFLRVASNNFMYIFCTGTGAVAKVDGTTAGGTAGTITANVLTIPHKQIVDAADWRNYLYIAVQDSFSGSAFAPTTDAERFSYNCGVYIWDRSSTVVGTRDYIPLYGVKTINRLYVAHDGKLRVICVASSGVTQIREYNGSSFEVIHELGTTAAPQWWDAVTTSDYATFWVGQDKYIYAHGAPTAGFSNGVYKIGYLTSNSITAGFIGFLYYANVSEGTTEGLIVDYKDSSAAKTQKILFNYSSATAVTSYSSKLPDVDAGIIKTKVNPLPFASNIHSITVYFAPITGSGSSSVAGNIKVYLNLSLTATKSVDITKTDLVKGYKEIPVNKQYVNAIQLGIDYSTNTVVTVDGIAADMMPWYAEVDVTRTKTDK